MLIHLYFVVQMDDLLLMIRKKRLFLLDGMVPTANLQDRFNSKLSAAVAEFHGRDPMTGSRLQCKN